METLALGGRRYVLGLRWVDGDPAIKAAAQVKEAANGGRVLFGTAEAEDGRHAVGFIPVVGAPKGKLYSYAGALAKAGHSGVFAALLDSGKDDPRLWYTVVADGLVVPETDAVASLDAGLTAIEALREAFGLPLFYTGREPLPLRDFTTFDPEGAVEGAGRLKPLQAAGGTQIGGIVVLGLVLAGVGAGAWYMLREPPAPQGDDAAAIAWAERTAYLGGMHSVLDQLPADTGWVINAYAAARQVFVPALAGWRLEGFTCTPDACVATYTAGEAGHALVELVKHYGKARVGTMDDQRSATVNVPLTVTRMAWTDDQILAPLPTWRSYAADVAARVPLHFARLEVDGQIASTDLSAANTMPADALPIMQDVIAVKQAAALESNRLAAIVNHFAQDGFAATALSVSGGMGATPSAYRIEFTRTGPALQTSDP